MNVMEKTDTVRTHCCTLRSRSLIERLYAGDQVVVSVPAGYATFANSRETVFSGFLIWPM